MSYPQVMASRAAPLRTYWRLGEGPGIQHMDSSGNGNHSTAGNQFNIGGSALLDDADTSTYFWHIDGYLSFPDSPTLRTPPEWSVAAMWWLQTNGAGVNYLCSKGAALSENQFYIYRSGTQVLWGIRLANGAYIYGTTAVGFMDAGFTHVVFTFKLDPFTLTVYKNGQPFAFTYGGAVQGSTGHVMSAGSATWPFYLGNFSPTGDGPTPHAVDEFGFFTGSLTAVDALALYNESRSKYGSSSWSGDSDLSINGMLEKPGAVNWSGDSDFIVNGETQPIPFHEGNLGLYFDESVSGVTISRIDTGVRSIGPPVVVLPDEGDTAAHIPERIPRQAILVPNPPTSVDVADADVMTGVRLD